MSRSARITLAVIALATLTLGEARADFQNEGGKSGPLMFNLKLGGALNLYASNSGAGPSSFVMVLDAGYAIVKNGYLLFAPQFQVGGTSFAVGNLLAVGYTVTSIILPVGFQYDIPLPLAGLFLTPRASIGYAARVVGCDGCGVSHSGFVALEFGVKYVLHNRWNFGVDPVSLPIFFGGGPNHDQAFLDYRFLVYAGANL